jgi:hypothetical protein
MDLDWFELPILFMPQLTGRALAHNLHPNLSGHGRALATGQLSLSNLAVRA